MAVPITLRRAEVRFTAEEMDIPGLKRLLAAAQAMPKGDAVSKECKNEDELVLKIVNECLLKHVKIENDAVVIDFGGAMHGWWLSTFRFLLGKIIRPLMLCSKKHRFLAANDEEITYACCFGPSLAYYWYELAVDFAEEPTF